MFYIKLIDHNWFESIKNVWIAYTEISYKASLSNSILLFVISTFWAGLPTTRFSVAPGFPPKNVGIKWGYHHPEVHSKNGRQDGRTSTQRLISSEKISGPSATHRAASERAAIQPTSRRHHPRASAPKAHTEIWLPWRRLRARARARAPNSSFVQIHHPPSVHTAVRWSGRHRISVERIYHPLNGKHAFLHSLREWHQSCARATAAKRQITQQQAVTLARGYRTEHTNRCARGKRKNKW